MYKRLFNRLPKHNMLYEKQFGFQQARSTEHVTIQLIDHINDNFIITIVLHYASLLIFRKHLALLNIKS